MSELENSIYTSFVVNRIKDIYFSINEELLFDFNKKKLKFEIGKNIGANTEHNLINLTIRVHLHYENENEIIAEIKVQNLFVVKDLNTYIIDDKLKLSSDIIVSMVSVGIAHTRALLAKNLSGTQLDGTILPIVNPLKLAQQFFPDLFNNKGLSKQPTKKNASHYRTETKASPVRKRAKGAKN